jgi:hypothetical protein
MANIMPTSFKKDLGTAKIDWLNDTFKMMLLTSAATLRPAGRTAAT